MAIEQGQSFNQPLFRGIHVPQGQSSARTVHATVANPRSPVVFSGLNLQSTTALVTAGKQFGGITSTDTSTVTRNDDVRKHEYVEIETIAFEMPRDSEAVVQLNLLNPATIASENGFSSFRYKVNIFLKELRCTATIRSVDDIALPNITDEDSRTTQIIKANNMEWENPRKELVGWIKKPAGDWIELPAVSLLNVSGFKYREYNLMRVFSRAIARGMGQGDALGVSIVDVGHGVLTDLDRVIVDGYLSYEFVIFDYT